MSFSLPAIGGTRFVLALGSGLMTTLLQWFGKLDPSGAAYVAVVLGVVGAYITGNVKEAKYQADAAVATAAIESKN